MNSEDLKRICEIVNGRNELQKVRNSARHKVTRLEMIVKSLQNKKKLKKLTNQADVNKCKSIQLAHKLRDLVANHKFESRDTELSMSNSIHDLLGDGVAATRKAKEELEKNKWSLNSVKHGPKHEKTTLHRLKTDLQLQIAKREMAMYEIMEFTESTTLELRRLLNKSGAKLRNDGNGGVDYILYNKQIGTTVKASHLTKSEIKKIAEEAEFDKVIEEVLS